MPELPEVRVVVKKLKECVLNKTIDSVIVNKTKMIKDVDSEAFQNELKNQKIIDISNVAKHIVFFLTNNLVMISHLRMEGKYRYYDQKHEFEKHAHVVFNFSDNSQLQYVDSRAFGTFHLRNKNNYLTSQPLASVALTPDKVDIDSLYAKTSKSSTAIKTMILNQKLVSGIGNIYADESLFAAKIHPQTPSKLVSKQELKLLMQKASEIMHKSEELGGSTIDSYESLNKQEGQYQHFLKVHTKVNKPCTICQTIIQKTKTNGRGTYFCPKCQKLRKQND
ncbi:DNA-formamidopyrimidine glycosylase [Mycoplasma sp. 4044]